MARRKIPLPTLDLVRQRANHLCEYCHTLEAWQYIPFTIDHLTPVSQGGDNSPENLALACFHCNRRKGDQITAFDPVTRQPVPIFHPRQDRWSDHFVWSPDKTHLIGLTPVGRATIRLLEMNRQRVLDIRSEDVEIGRHPPEGDPVQVSE